MITVTDEAVMISVRQTVLSVEDVNDKQPGMCCFPRKIPAD
jgi:hypothetical protein